MAIEEWLGPEGNEVAALKYDIKRHIQITTDQQAEIERLRSVIAAIQAHKNGQFPMVTPWSVRPDDDGSWEVFYVANNGMDVIVAYGLTEQLANLIRAAPDMQNALNAAINWFTPPNDSRTPFPAKQICDALARASGESQ